MVKFHKNIGIRTLFSSSSSFPKKLIIFFNRYQMLSDLMECWTISLKNIFSMGLKRRVHYVSLDPIRYTSLLCLISVQIFLLISSFFRPSVMEKRIKDSMECLLDNNKQNAYTYLFFDRLYQSKNMLN